MAVVHVLSTYLLNGSYPPLALLIFELPLLVFAFFVSRGKRWAIIIGTIFAALLFVLTAAGAFTYLTQPQTLEFYSVVLFLALGVVVIIYGLRALKETT
jgi:putative Ca2+/H+ antiporter (TMEM165/GDT1 family)